MIPSTVTVRHRIGSLLSYNPPPTTTIPPITFPLSLTTLLLQPSPPTGNLKLILGAGSHSVALQWESTPGLAGSNWTLLNNAAVNGFTHGEELLVMITSENAQPTIAIAPSTGTVIHGYENQAVSILGLSVGDVDVLLAPGMMVMLNISVSVGSLSFPHYVPVDGQGNPNPLSITLTPPSTTTSTTSTTTSTTTNNNKGNNTSGSTSSSSNPNSNTNSNSNTASQPVPLIQRLTLVGTIADINAALGSWGSDSNNYDNGNLIYTPPLYW